MALALLGGLAGALFAATALGLSRRMAPQGPGATLDAPARGGFEMKLEDGRLRAMSRAARRFLGGEALDAQAVFRRLTSLDGPFDTRAALRDLELDGRAFRLLADDDRGRAWEVTGAPESGEARLSFAPAGPARREIARLRAALLVAGAERDAALESLDKAPVMVWRAGPDGAICWANRLYHEAVEAAATEGKATDGAPAEAEPGRGSARTLRLDAAGGRMASPGEGPAPWSEGRHAVFDPRTGERRWFEFRKRQAADGGVIAYATDAAAAVHAEAALRRFVETLTETFAHLRIGLAIFDRETRLGLFNPAFASLMRLDPAWLAGRPLLSDVLLRLRENQRMPERKDFGAWRRAMLELFGGDDDLTSDRPERTEVWHLPGEEQIRLVARPHPQGAVAFLFEDVSETARLERRWLTETEIRRAVMDRLEEGVAAFSPDGAASFANPAFAAIWGFRPDEPSDGLRLAEALPRFRAASAPTAARAWDRLAEFFAADGSRSPWSEEVELRDGRRLRARVAALPDGSVLTAFTDVTARAAAARPEAGPEPHDPLDDIISYAGMLREGAAEAGNECDDLPADFAAARREHYAEGILEAAEELREALEDGGAGSERPRPAAASSAAAAETLQDVLASALSLAGRAAARRGVRLRTLPAGKAGAGPAPPDAARLRQLLFNLVTDAVHRAPEGDEVAVSLRRSEGRIEAATEARRSPGRDATGGVALSLVRRYAEHHQGAFRTEACAASGAPGEVGPADAATRVTFAVPEAVLSDHVFAPGRLG